MLLKHAKDLARQWVLEQGVKLPGFAGAFFHGSTTWLPDDATLPVTSDLDVMVALDGPEPAIKLGKFRYHGVLLEVSYMPLDQLESPEQVLGISHLAGSFRRSSVIADPTGRLTPLQTAVAAGYAKRTWVRKRCEHAQGKILHNLQGIDSTRPLHDQVLAWLFATGVTTHVLLVAGLKNPTVRRRYEAVRALLAEYDRTVFYECLVELLGCARMSQTRAAHHLDALAQVFDAAKMVGKTPFFFSSDISDEARPIAMDGSRTLIEQGDHREAVFWMLATYSRCQTILYHDAAEAVRERFDPGYRALLADLGIASASDLVRRGEEVRAFLPQLQEVAEAIMHANPEVVD